MTDGTLTQQIFRTMFLERRWKSKESVSGSGSALKATELIRENLAKLFTEFDIKTLVDAPCGDCNWIRRMAYEFDGYIGIDIVPELMVRLRTDVVTSNWRFQVGDIVTDVLPRADALLCRDCLVHLPLEFSLRAIANWKAAGFKYVIATTFPGVENRETPLGQWRRLDMQTVPFNFPSPEAVIRERAPNPADPNNAKSLALWRTEDLPFARP
jgi:hypothetical protein